MLRPEALLSYVRSQPFKTFRIKMLNGTVYEIRHPEMIRGVRDFFVYFHAPSPEAPADTFETISLVHVEKIIRAEQQATDGN